ncbi:MAG: hypothetical protein ACE5E6_03265 [Phycisphaerae bacterium]
MSSDCSIKRSAWFDLVGDSLAVPRGRFTVFEAWVDMTPATGLGTSGVKDYLRPDCAILGISRYDGDKKRMSTLFMDRSKPPGYDPAYYRHTDELNTEDSAHATAHCP